MRPPAGAEQHQQQHYPFPNDVSLLDSTRATNGQTHTHGPGSTLHDYSTCSDLTSDISSASSANPESLANYQVGV